MLLAASGLSALLALLPVAARAVPTADRRAGARPLQRAGVFVVERIPFVEQRGVELAGVSVACLLVAALILTGLV